MTKDHSCSYYCERPECIKAQRDELRDRLAQPEQEPAAWLWRCKPHCGWPEWSVSLKRPADAGCDGNKRTEGYEDIPLYTAPPQPTEQEPFEDLATELFVIAQISPADDGFSETIERIESWLREHFSTPPQPEQPEQEPVAWEDVLGAIARGWTHDDNKHKTMDVQLAVAIAKEIQDMVIAPPQRKPLTWERVLEIGLECANDRSRLPFEVKVARAIEAAHGIKENT